MNDKLFAGIILAVTLAVCAYLVTDLVRGQEVSLGATVRWNCENFFTSPHPMPVSIENDDNGDWSVLLEDGSVLIGRVLDGGFMRWDLDDMHWMTDGIDVVYCESDAKSISILLAP